MLPKKAIKKFKKIYRRVFGVSLTEKEASRRANNLLDLYKAVYNKSFWIGKSNSRKKYL